MPSVVATLQALVGDLRAMNAGQQATILELRATITQHSGNSYRPPSSDLPGHCAKLTLGATCRMHGLDLFAYLAEVCNASMAGLAVPQLLPAPA